MDAPDHNRIHADLIKHKAQELGFDACGIAPAMAVSESCKESLLSWLHEGCHGQMAYMANHLEKRLNPSLLEPGSLSVISLALNYYQDNHQHPQAYYKISRYAAGQDYHFVIKEKLNQLLQFIQAEMGPVQARVFTDSAPVAERYWAQQAGLGWIGKNACLILPRKGSFFFLAEILLDLPLAYDQAFEKDFCGNCTRCLDACPTGALCAPAKVDARKCISYLTIELKDDIPEAYAGKLQQNIFGCDICQDVCPHNQKFARATREPRLAPLPAWQQLSRSDLEQMDSVMYKWHFVKQLSPLARIKHAKFLANMRMAAQEKE